MGSEGRITSSGSKARKHRVYFKDPKCMDMEKLAMRIVELRRICDVSLGNHRHGYSASVCFFDKVTKRGARKYIESNIGKSFGQIVVGKS